MPDRIPLSLTGYREYPVKEMLERATSFSIEMQRRRTVREFSDRPVPRQVIEDCLRAAASAPSGAHCQPWHFVVVSHPEVKHRIREAAEEVEHEFYGQRAPAAWLSALTPLGTGPEKPFLEVAPYLIAVFEQRERLTPDGSTVKNYYPAESVGIATGILVTALHHAGLAVLTYTPRPMGFLSEILGRPAHERPFMLLVTGYPALNATVPDIERKPLDEVVTFME